MINEVMNSLLVIAVLIYVAFIAAFLISCSVLTGQLFDEMIKNNGKIKTKGDNENDFN